MQGAGTLASGSKTDRCSLLDLGNSLLADIRQNEREVKDVRDGFRVHAL